MNVKTIKIQKLFKNFFQNFKKQNEDFSKSRSFHQFIPILTKFFVEFILFTCFGLIIYLNFESVNNNFSKLLPVATFFIVIIYRLVPSIQTIYSSLVNFYSSLSAMEMVSDLISLDEDKELENNEKVAFNSEIKFKNISFSYESKKNLIHNNFTENIKKNSLCLIVGKSGSGKSTLLDIMTGLIEPTDGDLVIDDNKINDKNLYNWQSKIGYMGQDIVLIDDTIKKNIEFGNEEKINESLYIEALKIFFNKEEINKFKQSNFTVGERGKFLSFGQRQRVILTRLYVSNKEVLILDEPTSSLDEKNINILKSVLINIKGKRTVIITTHNNSFDEISDKIIGL